MARAQPPLGRPKAAAAPTPKLPGLDAAELPADAIEVGRIADAWGIKGWFKVLPHSASPEALFSSKRWYLQPSERGAKTFSGTVVLRVRETKDHSGTIVAWRRTSPTAPPPKLSRARACSCRAPAFPRRADEYYWVDLMGLEVVNREGVALGRVSDLMSTGPQTVLVLEFRGGWQDPGAHDPVCVRLCRWRGPGRPGASRWTGSPTTERSCAHVMRFDVITLFPELFAPISGRLASRAGPTSRPGGCAVCGPARFCRRQLPPRGRPPLWRRPRHGHDGRAAGALPGRRSGPSGPMQRPWCCFRPWAAAGPCRP
jgi:16S rRNA processing protein RimM